MAVTSTKEYITHRNLKDIYPGLSEYDTKQRIYGWTSIGNDRYISENTGLITVLYSDSKELNEAQGNSDGGLYRTLITSNLGHSSLGHNSLFNTMTYNAGAFTEGSEDDIKAGDFVQFNKSDGLYTEIAYVESVNTGANQITVRRANSSALLSAGGDNLYLESYITFGGLYQWYYDSDHDSCILYSTTDPSDLLIESGEDWATLLTRTIRRASRMVESLLDSRMRREIMKDREGNYPEFIQRAVGLKTITLLMRSNDPENPVVESFEEEFNEIIEGYRTGLIALPNAVTADSSKGVIRDVSVNASSDLRPVELRGNYDHSGFDLLKLKVITGGVIGTATYSVWMKDHEKLKNNQVVTASKISGDFDLLVTDLYIRFQGDDDSAIVTADDEWEIEVHGYDCETSITQGGNISLSRRDN